MLLAPIPSREYDIERATWNPPQGSRNGHALMPDGLGVRYICRRANDPVLIDNRLSAMLQITNYSLNNDSGLPAMPTATASTTHISDSEPSELLPIINNNVTRKAATQFNNASVSRVPPVREVERTDSRLNEGPTTTTLPWHSRALSPFTLYSELSTARTPEQYASVHSRLRQEWLFIGGFVGRFTTAS